LKDNFRPKFLNRIDEIIIFNYLGRPEIKKIVELELEKVSNRLKERKIQLVYSESTKGILAELGFDPNLGARPLKRVIQKKVLDPLSFKIVSGEIREEERILVDAEDGEIIFRSPKNYFKIGPKKLKKALVK
jgi:ATP-dependent Clp protease ATP-binding subunit ClpA